MRSVAVYSVKGGVGKSTIATHLAWCAAAISQRRTLLWDLDPQGSASFLLRGTPDERQRAQSVFARSIEPKALICHTGQSGLDLLPADKSLRQLSSFFAKLDRRRRLAKIAATLAIDYDRIIFDCPPVMNEVSDQAIRAADVILIPLTPSPLAWRALDEIRDELARNHKGHGAILPVLSMVDRRRTLHRAACADHPDWPVIPMSSQVEQAAVRREPLGQFGPNSPATEPYATLWRSVERKLVAMQ